MADRLGLWCNTSQCQGASHARVGHGQLPCARGSFSGLQPGRRTHDGQTKAKRDASAESDMDVPPDRPDEGNLDIFGVVLRAKARPASTGPIKKGADSAAMREQFTTPPRASPIKDKGSDKLTPRGTPSKGRALWQSGIPRVATPLSSRAHRTTKARALPKEVGEDVGIAKGLEVDPPSISAQAPLCDFDRMVRDAVGCALDGVEARVLASARVTIAHSEARLRDEMKASTDALREELGAEILQEANAAQMFAEGWEMGLRREISRVDKEFNANHAALQHLLTLQQAEQFQSRKFEVSKIEGCIEELSVSLTQVQRKVEHVASLTESLDAGLASLKGVLAQCRISETSQVKALLDDMRLDSSRSTECSFERCPGCEEHSSDQAETSLTTTVGEFDEEIGIDSEIMCPSGAATQSAVLNSSPSAESLPPLAAFTSLKPNLVAVLMEGVTTGASDHPGDVDHKTS